MTEALRVGRWRVGTGDRNPVGDIDHDPVALGHDWRYDAEVGRTKILRSDLAPFRVTAKDRQNSSLGGELEHMRSPRHEKRPAGRVHGDAGGVLGERQLAPGRAVVDHAAPAGSTASRTGEMPRLP